MVLARVTVRIDFTIPSGAICIENEGHGIPGHRRHVVVVVVVLDLILSIENLCESVQFFMFININMKCRTCATSIGYRYPTRFPSGTACMVRHGCVVFKPNVLCEPSFIGNQDLDRLMDWWKQTYYSILYYKVLLWKRSVFILRLCRNPCQVPSSTIEQLVDCNHTDERTKKQWKTNILFYIAHFTKINGLAYFANPIRNS